MKIITSNEEYFKALRLLARPKSEIRIATYNLYAGVFHDGRYSNEWENKKWHNRVGEFFDHLHARDISVEIKVSKPIFKECQLSGDSRCANHKQEEKWDGRLDQMDKRWPKFTFRLVALSHVKLLLIKHGDDVFSIYGGRNLTDPPLDDLSFIDPDPKMFARLEKVYNDLR